MSLPFLQELYLPYDPETVNLCEIRCLRADRQGEPVVRYFGASHLAKAATFAQEQSAVSDVYMGVLPRARKAAPGRAGVDRDIETAAWLWCDLDRGQATDAEMLDFLAHIRRRLPQPRFVVLSGSGGCHLYWALPAPLSLPTDDARARFTAVLRRVVTAIGTGPNEAHADRSCCNPSRILRVPHTLNHKHDPPRRVEAVVCTDAARLTLEEWESFLPFEPLPVRLTRPRLTAQKARSEGVPPGLLAWAEKGYPEGQRHQDLVGAAAWLRRDTDLKETEAWDLFLLKAANSLGRRPITEAELESAWRWAA